MGDQTKIDEALGVLKEAGYHVRGPETEKTVPYVRDLCIALEELKYHVFMATEEDAGTILLRVAPVKKALF
jgi:hypothetical protein